MTATRVDTATATLTTTDGVTHAIPVEPGVAVLDAAAQQGAVLPQLCGQGTCGSCVARHTGGAIERGPQSPDALGPSAGDDAVLLCRTYALDDCSFDLPYGQERIVDTAPPVRTATLTQLETLGPDIVRLRLTYADDPEHGSASEFDAGQFVQVAVPGTGDQRAYSLANVANWDGELELIVHVLARGVFSDWLRERAAVGDELQVTGPQGAFGLVENGMRPRWFVAGGSGLAPLLSMLRRMAEWGEAQPARLYLGANTLAGCVAEPEIADLAAALPEFTATRCVWHPEDDLPPHGYLAGTPADALSTDLAAHDGEAPDLYVCGPPAMVQAVEDTALAAGLPADRIHTERFTQN